MCGGVGFVSACMSNLATATQLLISELLSHSIGGLYVQSGDNINSQDNSAERNIGRVQITYRNKMHSIIMHNVIHNQISVESGLLHLPWVNQGRPCPADRLGRSRVDQDPRS